MAKNVVYTLTHPKYPTINCLYYNKYTDQNHQIRNIKKEALNNNDSIKNKSTIFSKKLYL